MKSFEEYLNESLAAEFKQDSKSKPAQQAKKLGLKYLGFGRYGDKSGKVAYLVHNDNLVPFKGTEKAYADVDKSTAKKDPQAKQQAQSLLSAHLNVKKQGQKVFQTQTKKADALDNKLKKIYPAEAFTPEEAKTLYDYTDWAYKNVNDYLNMGHAEGTPYSAATQIEKIVADLDQIFLGKELPIELSVYSGLSSRYNPESFVVGETYAFKGFISTSLSPERPVDSFAKAKESNSKVTLQIDLKKGQKALYIDGVSSFPGEQEVLLPRGTLIKVLSGPHELPNLNDTESKNKSVLVHCEVVDEDE